MNKCSCPPSQYFYSASAYGFSAELERPTRHSIQSQAPSVLGSDGGRGSARLRDFKYDGFLSVEDAHTEVGGSYDECHNIHTTYAYSALEGVNVGDVLTADRVVSRLYIYSPGDPADKSELSFTIGGSHFENLKIAGYEADVQLAHSVFHGYDTYSSVVGAHQSGTGDAWMIGSKLAALGNDAVQKLENTYHALMGMSGLISGWNQPKDKRSDRGTYFLSPANELKLKGYTGKDVQVAGNMVFVPKFGVIRLAELMVHRNCRTLTMFKVHMCSGASGSTSGGTTQGGGGRPGGGG